MLASVQYEATSAMWLEELTVPCSATLEQADERNDGL